MKEESVAIRTRRWFLRAAGAAGVAGALPTLAAAQTVCPPKDRIELFAEGIVPLSHLLSGKPPLWTADQLAALQAGTTELRLRLTTQNSGMLLVVQLYLATPGSLLPQKATPNRFGLPTVQMFTASITDTLMAGNLSLHNFAIRGKITGQTVKSWFGNVMNSAICFGSGYNHVGTAEFTLLGGAVSGVFAAYAPKGLGRTYNYFMY